MSYADRDKYGIYQPRSGASSSPGPGPSLMGADTLIGDSVVNGNEEDLGDIKEIMLDMHTGQVAYAVLSFGGFLGIGEKLFAVPWGALHLDTVNERFVLNVDKARLKNAPGFDPGTWPDMSDVNWAKQIHTFYGTDPQQSNIPSMGPSVAMGGVVSGGSPGSASRSGAGNLQSGAGTGSGTGGDLGNIAGGAGNLSGGTTMPGTRGKKNPGDSDI
ncbi:PRC-barrel domain-containing protein [Massilia sp. S19_KUP03_FR1]|uniref:PRC-barrel domain-containing protein n=1 Tax=Massilia sp. S19_KUP03_FR1 TaxID=3025503 RepID=UPI002FCD64E8